MSGASLALNQIVRNLNTEIDLQLREKNCQSLPSDVRVKVPAYPPYRYPDLTALCGRAEIENLLDLDVLINPQLIVEVLSDSTAATSLLITNQFRVFANIFSSRRIART